MRRLAAVFFMLYAGSASPAVPPPDRSEIYLAVEESAAAETEPETKYVLGLSGARIEVSADEFDLLAELFDRRAEGWVALPASPSPALVGSINTKITEAVGPAGANFLATRDPSFARFSDPPSIVYIESGRRIIYRGQVVRLGTRNGLRLLYLLQLAPDHALSYKELNAKMRLPGTRPVAAWKISARYVNAVGIHRFGVEMILFEKQGVRLNPALKIPSNISASTICELKLL